MINLARRLLKGALAFRSLLVAGSYGHSTGTQNDYVSDLSVDVDGNAIAAGYTSTSAQLPGFVIKYSAMMLPQWQRQQSMADRFSAQKIGADGSGNIYSALHGYPSGSVHFPHLSKYNSAGTNQWQRKLTDASNSLVGGLAVNSSGDSYIGITVYAGTNFSILGKYNSSGTLQWQRKISDTYNVTLAGVALTHDGGVVVLLSHTIDGTGNGGRMVVVKYDSSGAIQWQFSYYESASYTYAAAGGIVVDSVTGDIYLSGSFNSSGGGSQLGALLKLNSSGTVQWNKIHSSGTSFTSSMAVDTVTGDVFVSCFQPNSLTQFSSSGTAGWRRTYAGSVGIPAVYGDDLFVGGGFSRTGAGTDLTILKVPKSTGGTAGTYGHIVIADPGAITYSAGTITKTTTTLTDAAGASTDAAGTATESSGTLTFASL